MKKFTLISIFFLGTVLCNAQCFEDRHNGNWFDAWISCEDAPNPNSARGNGHWIFYDFHHTYSLGASTIWNFNRPESTDNGMNEIVIDYSLDGVNWEEWGSFVVPEAPGISTYEGDEGPNFEGIQAKYMVITALSNYGGDCVGMSEIKINVQDVIISDVPEIERNTCLNLSVFPNPHTGQFTTQIKTQCPELIQWTIYNAQGKQVKDGILNQVNEENFLDISTSKLPAGLYHFVVIQGESRLRKPLLKVLD